MTEYGSSIHRELLHPDVILSFYRPIQPYRVYRRISNGEQEIISTLETSFQSMHSVTRMWTSTHTIDNEEFSANVLTSRASQKYDRTCEIFWISPTTSWDTFADLTKACRVLEQTFIPIGQSIQIHLICYSMGYAIEMQREDVHIGSDISRDDPIHLNVILAPFVAQRFGQLSQGALRSRVGWNSEASLSEATGKERNRCQPSL